jgi:hypothetical protein
MPGNNFALADVKSVVGIGKISGDPGHLMIPFIKSQISHFFVYPDEKYR